LLKSATTCPHNDTHERTNADQSTYSYIKYYPPHFTTEMSEAIKEVTMFVITRIKKITFRGLEAERVHINIPVIRWNVNWTLLS